MNNNLSWKFLTNTVCVVTKAVYTLTIFPDARTVRERFASGCPCTHCVHCVGFALYTQTTSGCVRSGRERFASGCPCTHCVQCVGFVRYTQTTSGCVLSGRERVASAWLCSVNARMDASGASGRERRTVCACLQTDLLLSTDTIHMTRKCDICHELSTCNWVTTGREAAAVCTRRSGRVPFASGQSFIV